MWNDIKAEHLKCSGTFIRKLVVLAPVIMVLLAFVSGKYFAENGYNWWYMMIFPGFLTLLAALVNQNEEKKQHYRAVYALPVRLQSVWISKVLLLVIYTAAASMIHLAGMILGRIFYNTGSGITLMQMTAATLVTMTVTLWQIPFCLFLARKTGFVMTILINAGGGILFNLYAVSGFFWWLCPYSWNARLMCPVLGLLPNGLLVPEGNSLLNASVIPAGLIFSIVLFAVLTIITAEAFRRQEGN